MSGEDQWSGSQSSKRYSTPSRSYDEYQRSNTIAAGRRYNQEDNRSAGRTDPRLDRVQNGTHRDRQRRSTDDDSSDRKINTPGSRTRVTSPSDDRFERVENALKRAPSLRRDIMLDDLERSSTRRDSRRSSFESDGQVRKTPSRDVTSPRRTSEERARLLERQSSQGGHSDRASRDELESRSTKRREQQIRDELLARRDSLQRRVTPEDPDRISAKRSSGRSSLESDSQSLRKTPSKETPAARKQDGEDWNLPRTINDLQITERQRSIEKNQQVKDPTRTAETRQKRQESGDAKQQTRKSQPRENPAKTDAIEGHSKVTGAASRRTASDEAAGLMEIPKEEWACEHCTFINKINDRVCVVCCKTRSSALPPSTVDPAADQIEVQAPKNETPSGVSNPDLEKRANPPKTPNSEESGDSGSVRNKGRPKRKISFSFGTKLSK